MIIVKHAITRISMLMHQKIIAVPSNSPLKTITMDQMQAINAKTIAKI